MSVENINKNNASKYKIKKGIVIVFFIIFCAGIMLSGLFIRPFGSPYASLMDDHFLQKGQQETGSNNIVTAVVFDYRGFDTLGETTILFSAVLGISVLIATTKEIKQKSKK